ncbi:Serine/threonine-protein kinase Nek5 [Tritrichomonas foetus]|uniref:non-specific serine/threonine protein kinase n=1 Tax=Tritrichomonas foetus TaxID=1144522 RepID=A0A1J4KTU1_9EUKA|nr:Serine/threonine-protein kinase Nek5 [Tritrichomonas foetus]|eukprot:OHT14679.1 Serine/threonine-protein kinase Nek5 [Tritrichomonas foetus]
MKSSDEYLVQSVIGEGSYGRALLCKEKNSGQLIVVKEISFANLTEEECKESRKETHILSKLHHPNIIGFRGSFLEKNIFHIVMDYADGGDLGQKIANQTEPFSEDQVLDWFVQLCLALKHCHDRKILHRDLKTQNVFLTQKGLVKLGDFGISKILEHTTSFAKTSIGTPYYLSPEICEGRPYNEKSDIWSLGCVLYEICTLKHPFDSNCINGLIVKIIRCRPAPIPKCYSANLQGIIDSLLQKQPSKRPKINQILKMPLIQERITKLLSQTIAKLEFAHTVFHGLAGGETPAVIPEKPVVQAPKSRLSVRKSRLPTRQKTRSSAAAATPSASSVNPSHLSNNSGARGRRRPLTHEEMIQQRKREIVSEREEMKRQKEKKMQEAKKCEEEQDAKRQKILEKQKQRKQEREQRMALLRKEEKEKQKHYESLEAPFKKQRPNTAKEKPSSKEQSSPLSKSPNKYKTQPMNADEQNESSNSKPSKSKIPERSPEKSSSKEKLSESNTSDEVDEDFEEVLSDDLFEYDFISDEEEECADEELLSLAAVASDLNENPPDESDDEQVDEHNNVFTFRGKPLSINHNDPRPVRNESVRVFLEKNLGASKFTAAYRLITEESSTMNEDEFESKLSTILTTPSEMEFCPLIQQLVVSEYADM